MEKLESKTKNIRKKEEFGQKTNKNARKTNKHVKIFLQRRKVIGIIYQ